MAIFREERQDLELVNSISSAISCNLVVHDCSHIKFRTLLLASAV